MDIWGMRWAIKIRIPVTLVEGKTVLKQIAHIKNGGWNGKSIFQCWDVHERP